MNPVEPHDRALLDLVHPPDWRNPEPARRYNLVVLGAGTGGLVAAAVAAGLGAKVALVERDRDGRRLPERRLRAVEGRDPRRTTRRRSATRQRARASARARAAPRLRRRDGAHARDPRAHRADDSAQRFRDELGVDVFLGDGRFVAPDVLEVGGAKLRFRRAIATGARAAAPPIPGLAEAGFLTNETVFSLTAPPARLAIIGGGPIGCELAQTFARLGVAVTIFEMGRTCSTREDADAAAIVQRRCCATASAGARLQARLGRARGGEGRALRGSGRRAAASRSTRSWSPRAARPNVEDIGLEAAGVALDPARHLGRRSPAHRQPADLRGRRLLHGLEVHPRRRRRREDRRAERALRAQEALVAGDAVVHLHGSRARPRRPLRARRRRARHRDRHLQVSLEHDNRAVCDGETEGFVAST